ncbi:MAG TPA: plastocyanin/azurin family copper-binding protein [Solirubrobacteraceae bacterium]
MHTLAVQLAPVLAAEKSKTPFYIAGGLLVLWALTVSLGLGLRKPDFPGSLAGQRAVGAISAVLVLAAVSTAVITSGGGTQAAGAQGASPATTSSTATTTAPEATTTTESTPATTTAAKSPKATTGTPAPPSSPAAGASSELKLAANPAGQLAFDTKQLSAKAGTVTIDMSNSSPIEHDVAVAEGSKILGQTPVFTGGSKKLALKLKPGTYTFFCTVPGHRQAGMEGTLTVS